VVTQETAVRIKENVALSCQLFLIGRSAKTCGRSRLSKEMGAVSIALKITRKSKITIEELSTKVYQQMSH
jgi:hypothetical protein